MGQNLWTIPWCGKIALPMLHKRVLILMNRMPKTVVGKIIQDDAYIMMEREDGLYYLCAGAGLTPGFWRLKDKLGMQLKDVHTSSAVPYFKEKLQTGMERFFAKLPVDKVRYEYTGCSKRV